MFCFLSPGLSQFFTVVDLEQRDLNKDKQKNKPDAVPGKSRQFYFRQLRKSEVHDSVSLPEKKARPRTAITAAATTIQSRPGN